MKVSEHLPSPQAKALLRLEAHTHGMTECVLKTPHQNGWGV